MIYYHVVDGEMVVKDAPIVSSDLGFDNPHNDEILKQVFRGLRQGKLYTWESVKAALIFPQ